MIADLALVGCYNTSYMQKEDRNRVLLASAKRNLAAMSFFGLTEHQRVHKLHAFQNGKETNNFHLLP